MGIIEYESWDEWLPDILSPFMVDKNIFPRCFYFSLEIIILNEVMRPVLMKS